jgi:phosphoglycolate phosphatase
VIGDAVYDMQMAVSAGARAVGVSWGYGAVDALKAAGAHHVVFHADEIATLI